eukprot:10501408-Lingulodinium_polyedra.AAC.1
MHCLWSVLVPGEPCQQQPVPLPANPRAAVHAWVHRERLAHVHVWRGLEEAYEVLVQLPAPRGPLSCLQWPAHAPSPFWQHA